MGTVLQIQRFCIHDGPGIRTTVFLKGCPLACVWCHNPESQHFRPESAFYPEKCVGCGRCRGRADDPEFVCRHDARIRYGKEMRADEVCAEVEKDRIFYAQSGGGLTLSGGEPLAQPEFAAKILRRAKSNGIATAVETCGYAAEWALRKVAADTDLFLFDWKETDPVKHRAFTGSGNEIILRNLTLLSAWGKSIVLRCPIVPGYNDRADHFAGIAQLANQYAGIGHVELEPYHALGTDKYTRLGRSAPAIPTPDDAQVRDWIAQIQSGTAKRVIRS